jgi:hypothetical protein
LYAAQAAQIDFPAAEGHRPVVGAKTRAGRRVLVAVFEVTGALLVGALIYLVARPTDLLVFDWISAAGLEPALAKARHAAAPVVSAIPSFVVYSVPNGLWAYAFTSAMSHAWSHEWSRTSALWITVGPVVSIGSEIGQLFGMVPGTFDVADLAVLVAACAIALRRIAPLRSPVRAEPRAAGPREG